MTPYEGLELATRTAPPVRADTRSRTVLIVAVLLSAACGAPVLVDRFDPDNGGVTGAAGSYPLRLLYWGVLVSWPVALGTAVVAVARLRSAADRAVRVHGARLIIAAELIVPFTFYTLGLLLGHPLLMLAALPSTSFAVWVVYRMQRYRRMPVRVVLAAFGWGALAAVGFGGAMNVLYVTNMMTFLVIPN